MFKYKKNRNDCNCFNRCILHMAGCQTNKNCQSR